MQPAQQFSSRVCISYVCQEKDEEDPRQPSPAGTGCVEPAPLPSADSPLPNQSFFPLSGGIPRLVHFHKDLENLLYLRTSVEAGLTAAQGGSGDGTEQRQHCDVPRAGLKPEWNLCTPREK